MFKKKKNPKIVAYWKSYDLAIQNWLEIHFTNPNHVEKKSHCLYIVHTSHHQYEDMMDVIWNWIF